MADNMNIHVSYSDQSDDTSASLAERTVEEPQKKKYKKGFKRNAADRRVYDRKNLKTLNRRLKEWYQLTKCPTVALTLVGDKIYYSGPSQLQEFAKNNNVQNAFAYIVLQKPVEKENSVDIPIRLPSGWRDLNVFSRRKLVIALATDNGTKNPHWKNESYHPCWWPISISYVDPNNGRPRLSSAQLGRIIDSYNDYLMEIGAINEEQGGTDQDDEGIRVGGIESGEDGSIHGIVGGERNSRGEEIEGDDILNDGGNERVENERSEGVHGCIDERMDDESSVEVMGNDNNTTEERHLPSCTASVPLVPGGCQQKTCVNEMQVLLGRCVLCDEEEINEILAFLQHVHCWDNFVECVSLVGEKVNFDPYDMLPEEEQMTTRKQKVDVSLRCDVPSAVMKDGWEPVKVLGDGNCFFRAISCVLTGSGDDHPLLKLAVVAHGCANEDYYLKNCVNRENLDLFLHTITDEEIINQLEDGMSDEEKFQMVFQNEVMKTTIDGGYSGALKRRIIQYCKAPGCELYNSEVNPPNECSKVNAIHILWCCFGVNTSHPNHIVPLMKCLEGFNTHSKKFSGLCAAELFYQYSKDEKSAKRVKWVACDRCLQWFHIPCVTFTKETFGEHWFCGCSIPEVEIGQRGYSPSDLQRFCDDAQLKNFVEDILNGNIKSRRMNYFESANRSVVSANRLRSCNGWGIMLPNKKSRKLIDNALGNLINKKNLFPPNVPRTPFSVTRFKLDVLIPETVIWISSMLTNISRARAEEIHDKSMMGVL